ncbi:hypothetical protein LIER_04666 [Lithospermum erythrorhizon]|uniref:RRM domain-containing protein n=1 Tax=Lithospermum erythrorhizon TaxID=34254 RepID=A0AAV3NZG2_LITER
MALQAQTLYSSKPNTPLTPLNCPFSTPPLKLTTLSATSSSINHFLVARLVRNIAVSSEFNQVEEEGEGESFLSGTMFDSSEDDVQEVPTFSPDLKIFVGNLPFTADSSELASLFGRAGNVEMAEVIYDKMSGRSRGFGFVTMSSAKEVEAAVRQFNGYELDGRELRVNSGPPPPKRDNFSSGGPRGSSSFNNSSRDFNGGNRVYVGNLSWGVDDLALQNLFRDQGKVMEARVVYDRNSGRSRGFGFVTFSSAEEVNSAIEALDGAVSTLMHNLCPCSHPAESLQRRQF